MSVANDLSDLRSLSIFVTCFCPSTILCSSWTIFYLECKPLESHCFARVAMVSFSSSWNFLSMSSLTSSLAWKIISLTLLYSLSTEFCRLFYNSLNFVPLSDAPRPAYRSTRWWSCWPGGTSRGCCRTWAGRHASHGNRGGCTRRKGTGAGGRRLSEIELYASGRSWWWLR